MDACLDACLVHARGLSTSHRCKTIHSLEAGLGLAGRRPACIIGGHFSGPRNFELFRLVGRFHHHKWLSPGSQPLTWASMATDEATGVANAREKRREVNRSFRKFNYRFGSGDQIRAVVRKEGTCFRVNIEVTSSQEIETLYMMWVLLRTNATTLVVLDTDSIPVGTLRDDNSLQSPFHRLESGVHCLEFELDSKHAPVFISFSLYHLSSSNQKVWIRNTVNENFCLPVGCGRGQPDPLGAVLEADESLNFSLYSKSAIGVTLCLYKAGCTESLLELELQSSLNHTGNIWHIELDDVGDYESYGYRCIEESSRERGKRFPSGDVLLDPYSKLLADGPSAAPMLGLLTKNCHFNWEDDVHPNIPLEKIVAYRLNITGFTADKSSGLDKSILGTFEGVLEKLEHLKNLGVNAIILQPVCLFGKKNSYYPLSFFAPMRCFGPLNTSASSSLSLKKMIKELHKNGIEVLLDVVYTHTGESDNSRVSFHGLDKATYYILDKTGSMISSKSGADNCFNCNHPVVQTLVLDSLRYWVTEYHVDGFCFANASALTRGPHGEELSRPLLIEAISFDPVLSRRKLFADTSFTSHKVNKDFKFPHWKRWCLWNDKYRDDVRQFFRGDKGQLSKFATRLCGSGDMLADGRGPSFSLNYVTGPYGLTLVDLVSYSETADVKLERSWNCGEEGRTLSQAVLKLRVRQVRNFMMCLFLSQGIPILNMGDEYGLTKGGSISIDQRKVFNWDALNLDFGRQLTYLISALSAFRARRSDLFQRKEFLKLENIKWHGPNVDDPCWESKDSSFLAASLQPETGSTLGNVYMGFNSEDVPIVVNLPETSGGLYWYRIADTSLPYPDFFVEHGIQIISLKQDTSMPESYEIQPHSSVLLEARAAL